MSMGFSQSESRLALRNTNNNNISANNNIEHAASFILKRREEARLKREQERAMRAQRRIQQRYGKTAKGQWIDLETLKVLTNMGFEEGSVVEGNYIPRHIFI